MKMENYRRRSHQIRTAGTARHQAGESDWFRLRSDRPLSAATSRMKKKEKKEANYVPKRTDKGIDVEMNIIKAARNRRWKEKA